MALEPERQSMPEEVSLLPTTLHLSRYKGAELVSLRTNASIASKFEKHRDNIQSSIDKLAIEKNNRINRLRQTSVDLLEESDSGISSITCGYVYLKMRDELPELPAEDFIELFKKCLAINTSVIKNAQDKDSQTSLINLISTVKSHQAPMDDRTFLESTLSKMAGYPPKWFKGSEKDWRNFIANHSNFLIYLHHDLMQNAILHPNSLNDLIKTNDLSGSTSDGGYPDWLLESNDTLPTRQEVEKELLDDKEQHIKVSAGIEATNKQVRYLEDTFSEKIKKAYTRLDELANNQFAGFQTFADHILLLKAISRDPDLSSNRIAQDAIQRFTRHKNFAVTPEPIALYIERQLRTGSIVENSQSLIDDNFIGVLTSLLEHIQTTREKESSETDFLNLRTTNKKAFDALNHRLKPFLETLSSDELSFLKEMIAESKGMPVESFIWELASCISDCFKHTDSGKLSKRQLGELHYLSRFTASFINNHWKWAFEQIQQALTDQKTHDQQQEDDGSYQDPHQLQIEIDHDIYEVMQGNLKDWRIFYTDNRSLDINHLSEIGGTSLVEREKELQEFLLNEGLSSQIKTGSIIRALEWIVGNPKEIEQLRMTKEISGEKFKKIKRGSLRIFYILDEVQKTIIFFTHQKKAWSYGF